MFHFSFTLSEQEYLEFNLYHLYERPENRKRLYRQRFLYPFVWLMAMLVIDVLLSFAFAFIISLSVVVALLWVLFYKKLSIRGLKEKMRRMKKEGKLPFEPINEISFNEDKFTVKTENKESVISYSCFERVIPAKNALYLYYSVMQAYIIPYSVFSIEKEKTEFYDFICEKVQQNNIAV